MRRRPSALLAAPVPRELPEGIAAASPSGPPAGPAGAIGRLVRRQQRLALALSRLAEREGEEPLIHDAAGAALAVVGPSAGQRARTLADDARRLLDDVLAATRDGFLVGQARALEAVAATLAGERRAFAALVAAVAGAPVVAPTAERIARRTARLEVALPGRGHLIERVDAWRRRTALPATRRPLLHELVSVTVEELRRRTARAWSLPDGEHVELSFRRAATTAAASRFLGDGVSRLEVGVECAPTVCDLPRLLARETYPGRHVARAVLEGLRREGRLPAERGLHVALTPAAARLEGYATWAFDAVFPPAEAAAFAREELLPRAGVPPGDVDLEAYYEAMALVDPSELEAEAARRLAAGASEQAAGTYLAVATMLPPSVTAAQIPSMRSVLRRLRPCARAAGREALRRDFEQGGAAGLAAALRAGFALDASPGDGDVTAIPAR